MGWPRLSGEKISFPLDNRDDPMHGSRAFSPLLILLTVLWPLAACDGPVAPDFTTAGPDVAAAAAVDSDRSGAADMYSGSWVGRDLSFWLALDTTVAVAGRPVSIYAGAGTLGGEEVSVSGFDTEDGLALYVDRFVPPDVWEPLLYGVARRVGRQLDYAVTDPVDTRFILRLDRGKWGGVICRSARSVPASAATLSAARAAAVLRAARGTRGSARPTGPGHPREVRLGTGIAVSGRRYLTFNAVGEDGRCPVGADCVHPGAVEARFTLHARRGTVALVLTLPGGSPGALPLKEAPAASADGLLIRLLRIDPYPGVEFVGDPDTVGDGGVTEPSVPLDPIPPHALLVVEPCPDGVEVCGPGGGTDEA